MKKLSFMIGIIVLMIEIFLLYELYHTIDGQINTNTPQLFLMGASTKLPFILISFLGAIIGMVNFHKDRKYNLMGIILNSLNILLSILGGIFIMSLVYKN